ncbi:cilia- and flagella- associated protein 210 [Trichomycterus rosablanca]|uniref:cilia- and flagella- associated protein 210 n=1 Tax=Trichomycterus rosablanca TaxID=2290929 RepID=UPI002F354A5D
MLTASASVVGYGRRQGSSRKVNSAEVKPEPVDLRQVTVLPKSEWLRIQDSLNHVNRQRESLIAAARQRQDLHLRSKEVVKNWSNTIAGQRLKKLEAKKIREELEEEERKQIDLEEAKYQEEKRKEAIERAKSLLYYQTDRVKGFHSALLLTEVLKEREAQIELKKRKENVSKDMDKEIMAMLKHKAIQAFQQELQKTLENKQKCLSVAESLKQQIKVHEQAVEQERMEKKKEAEELQQLQEVHLKEINLLQEKKQEEKKSIMKAHQEHLAKRDTIQAAEAKKQKEEEERQRLFASTKQKIMKLRKEKEAELFRKVQRHRETLVEKLAAYHQEHAVNEEELTAKAAAEAEAKLDKQQREKDEMKAAMLKSIAEHREAVRLKQVQKDQEEKQKAVEMLNAKKAADLIYLEKQLFKAHRMKEDSRALQDTYTHQMARNHVQEECRKKERQEYDVRNAELIAQEENQFQKYAQQVIQTASDAQRNTYPLRKAAKAGIGGGLGPVFGGVRPSYLVQDQTGVEMPSYVGGTTSEIKELNETSDIHQAKKRLGFTWQSLGV